MSYDNGSLIERSRRSGESQNTINDAIFTSPLKEVINIRNPLSSTKLIISVDSGAQHPGGGEFEVVDPVNAILGLGNSGGESHV